MVNQVVKAKHSDDKRIISPCISLRGIVPGNSPESESGDVIFVVLDQLYYKFSKKFC